MIEFEIVEDSTTETEIEDDKPIEFQTTVDTVAFKNITGNVEDNAKLVNYIDTHGGKIDKIKVNGTEQPITDKEVDLSVPTKTSDLTNDSDFVSDANYVHTDNNYSNEEKEKLENVVSDVDDIKELIPSDASSTNQLADKNYVDTHIPTIPSFHLLFTWTNGEKSLAGIKGSLQDI